ncbi:MAG: ATP-dependent Clp protease ATP-binding subunit ClpX, partial [Alphaproteobacteria bacterium]|nr:ATP-dependent Clp protease ATP-binding subunit ClpX [Alphaproteobacteria bacterium]
DVYKRQILTTPKNSLVRQYRRLFEMEDVDLQVSDEALREIARRAIARKTGARGLRSILESVLLDSMFDVPSMTGVEKVVVNREAIEGKTHPLYLYGEGREGASRRSGGSSA